MNKKVSLGLCISLVIIAIAATFAATMAFSKSLYNGIINNISMRSQIYSSVDEINQIISNYFYGTVEDQNALNAALAEGYITGLGDSGSRYLDASEYSDYTEKLEGGVKGIGIETAYDYSEGRFIITFVYEDSPAEEAGLRKDDVITAIQNTTVTRNNYSNLSKQLYGSILQTVQIEYERDGETAVVEPMLGFSIPSVIGYLEGDVGYVRISGFYKNTPSEFKDVTDKLEQDGANSFIFDVRNTSEGSIDYAAQVIDVVVPTVSGNIAVARDKNGDIYKEKVYTSENSSINMPCAVLINSYTAGPAELFASNLSTISGATLIGTKTKGIGTMQELFPLEYGGAVLLTVALIEPKGGEAAIYNETGITPAVEVSLVSGDDTNLLLLTTEEDNQLGTALNMLAG